MNRALEFLLTETNTEEEDWESINGIPSGVGTEFWYKNIHTDAEAYICVDQDEIISFNVKDEE